jgi:hypothetical protein
MLVDVKGSEEAVPFLVLALEEDDDEREDCSRIDSQNKCRFVDSILLKR